MICSGFIVELDQLRAPGIAPLLKLLSLCFPQNVQNRKQPVCRHQGTERLGLRVAQRPSAFLATIQPIRLEYTGIGCVDPALQLDPMPERLSPDPVTELALIGRR